MPTVVGPEIHILTYSCVDVQVPTISLANARSGHEGFPPIGKQRSTLVMPEPVELEEPALLLASLVDVAPVVVVVVAVVLDAVTLEVVAPPAPPAPVVPLAPPVPAVLDCPSPHAAVAIAEAAPRPVTRRYTSVARKVVCLSMVIPLEVKGSASRDQPRARSGHRRERARRGSWVSISPRRAPSPPRHPAGRPPRSQVKAPFNPWGAVFNAAPATTCQALGRAAVALSPRAVMERDGGGFSGGRLDELLRDGL